jgi:hypothetical protein
MTQSDGDWVDGDIAVLIEDPPLTHKSGALAHELWVVLE